MLDFSGPGLSKAKVGEETGRRNREGKAGSNKEDGMDEETLASKDPRLYMTSWCESSRTQKTWVSGRGGRKIPSSGRSSHGSQRQTGTLPGNKLAMGLDGPAY